MLIFGASQHPVPGSQRAATLHPVEHRMAQESADPLLAQALTDTRAALEFDTAERNFANPPGAAVAPLERCDAWVRVELGLAEALSAARVQNHTIWHAPAALPGGAAPPPPMRLVEITPPTPAQLLAMLPRVMDAAQERADRMAEILVQDADLWSFWRAITGIDPKRAPRTSELIDVAYRMATVLTMCLKLDLAVPRPHELSAGVKPILRVPGHAALPSGHSVIAHMFAEMSPVLLGQRALARGAASGGSIQVQLRRLAARIARNRVVAGLHYDFDGVAGRVVGGVLASYFCAVSGQTGAAGLGVRIDAAAVPAPYAELTADFDPNGIDTGALQAPAAAGGGVLAAQQGNAVLLAMWDAAARELQAQGLA